MKSKLSGFLFILGLIVAFWPAQNLMVKIISATLILTFAGLPFSLKHKSVPYISLSLGLLTFIGFIAFNSLGKFDSVEAYMKVTKDSEVRYADVEELSKNFGVEGWNPYFLEWERKCVGGSYDYCRLASYVPRVKREKRAEELLRIGCANKDFLSCYNYFFYDEFKSDDRKFAGSVIMGQCKWPNMSSEYMTICGRVEQLLKAL